MPGTEGCGALVTSRVRMVDLAGAHLVDLDVMSPEEALTLFTKIVGEERVATEREAAMDVVAACGFLPLAIRIAASRLAARRTWTVSVLAAKLADERRRLDELRAGDLAVKATFELGYGQLEPAQARAFRLLGPPDGPDISLAAAAAVLDLSAEDTEDLLESLVDTSLLESAAPGRYRFHDLVRLYARACAERDEWPLREREAAIARLLDFYLATAAGVYRIERPGDRLVDHLEAADHPGLTFQDRYAARDWLYSEARSLLAAIQQAPSEGELRKGIDLLLVVRDLAESGSDANRYESVATALLDAATARGDARAEARVRGILAFVHSLTDRFEASDREARQAVQLGRATGDDWTTADALNDRGVIAVYQKRHEDGENHLTQAIEHYQALGDRSGEAGAAASEQLLQALTVFRDSRQRLWEGMCLFRLAEVDLAARRPAQAAANAETALAILRGIGGEWRRANVLTVLGRALAAIGQQGRAHVMWQEARTVFEELGSPEAESVRTLLDTNAYSMA
ncbi:tetratricopeptide (TPR) repeat protein [Streptomyces sp. V4I2]|nr:tetratricopeptide (TPR) repeat protein [Streptomyces sp. V4I2]